VDSAQGNQLFTDRLIFQSGISQILPLLVFVHLGFPFNSMKKSAPLIFFLLFSTFCLGQNPVSDSLKNVLQTAIDTNKVNVLLELSKNLAGSEPGQAIRYAEEAIALATQLKYPKGEAYGYKNIGLTYYFQGKYTEVLDYWTKSLKTFERIGDKVGESNLNSNIGAVYFNYGDYAQALDFYLKALKVAEQLGDKLRLATVLTNIGAVYEDQLKYDEALKYYHKGLVYSVEIDYKGGIGTSAVNIGTAYLAQGNYAEALSYFQKSLKALEESGNAEKVAYALISMGKAYAQMGKYSEAVRFGKLALGKAQSVDAPLETAQSLIGLGDTYRRQSKVMLAVDSYLKARSIAKEIGANYELKNAYDGLAQTYQQLGDYKNAFTYQSLLTGIKDTLYNAETTKKIGNLQASFENEKKQAQIDLLTKDKDLQELAIQRQRLVKNALIVGLVLILILAFVLFRNYQIKVKANGLLTQRNEEINSQKEEIATQRDNLEQTYNNLVSAQAQLVQSEKMASLGQLTAGVAHEINNPINFVSAGVDSLRANFTDITSVAMDYFALDPAEDNTQKLTALCRLRQEMEVEELIMESEQLLRSIKNGASRTTEIVKSLRNFTRLDENSLKKADLHEGIDSTLVILASKMKDRIEVIKEYGDLAPVECYPGQLNQVFMNILSNAVQAIEGKGTIWIRTSRVDGYAFIRIKDNGPGMTDEVRKRIFEPFFTTKEVGEGTGLGLSISFGIIEKHNGKIEVESKVGAGTEFTIKIPLSLSRLAPKAEAMAAY
jgi:signal transduction histidine kinase